MAKELEFGLKGFDIVTAGSGTGAWVAVQANGGDCTFSATTAIGDNQNSITLPDGAITYGAFTVITVTAGSAKCYRNVDTNFDSQLLPDDV